MSEKEIKTEEPLVIYEKKKIQFFSSLEEMNEADIEAMTSLSPAERIRNTVELILRAYGTTRKELNNRTGKRRIIFS